MSTASELVTLREGQVVPLTALQVLWSLEDRGLDVRLDGADIVVRPRGVLSDEDRATMRRLKPHLVALIAYCAQASDAHLRGR